MATDCKKQFGQVRPSVWTPCQDDGMGCTRFRSGSKAVRSLNSQQLTWRVNVLVTSRLWMVFAPRFRPAESGCVDRRHRIDVQTCRRRNVC